MPLSLKNLDVFPPSNPSQFDGRRLLECYRPVELLELTPDDFKAAYDFICLYRASFEMHMGENVAGRHEVTLNEAKAKNIGVTLARLTKCFPGEWYVDGDSKTLAIPLKLAPKYEGAQSSKQNWLYLDGPWKGEVAGDSDLISGISFDGLPFFVQDAIEEWAKGIYGDNVFDTYPIDRDCLVGDYENHWNAERTEDPITVDETNFFKKFQRSK